MMLSMRNVRPGRQYLKYDLKAALKSVVLSIVPMSEVKDADMDAIAQLCALASVPMGDEDPHALTRSMSDKMLDEIIGNFARFERNSVFAPVSQFFFIEWCYRNGYLVQDWKWDWDSADEGHVTYKSICPIDDILSGRNSC